MSSTRTPTLASTSSAADSPQRTADRDITPIGVDVGSKRLAVAATPDHLGGPVAGDAKYVSQLYSEFCSATHRLALAPDYDETSLGDLVARYWQRIRPALEEAAADVLSFACQHQDPVLVLEDLPQSREPLRVCENGGLRYSAWIPPTTQAILTEQAVDAEVPVVHVSPHNTSQECHRCGHIGDLDPEVLACTNERCPVEAVCRDRSAAATIAERGRERL